MFMNWFFFSIIGYFFNALSTTINKALLSRDIPSPAAMAFFIATLGMLVLVLLPFGIAGLTFGEYMASLASGLFFVAAIFTMFIALQKGQASYIPIFIGGFQPIMVFILAFIFLHESLTHNQLLGFILLTAGGLFIATRKSRQRRLVYVIALLSSACFAVSFVATKWVFDEAGFINGLFWTRIGALFGIIFILAKKEWRREITGILTRKSKERNTRTALGFLAAQGTGVISVVLIFYAISLGSVTLVNALQGVQYLVIFALVEPLGFFFPKLWKEELSKKAIIHKLISIVIVSIGLFFVAQ